MDDSHMSFSTRKTLFWLEILSIIANFQLLGGSKFYILRLCEKLALQIYLNFGMLLNTSEGNQMEYTTRKQ